METSLSPPFCITRSRRAFARTCWKHRSMRRTSTPVKHSAASLSSAMSEAFCLTSKIVKIKDERASSGILRRSSAPQHTPGSISKTTFVPSTPARSTEKRRISSRRLLCFHTPQKLATRTRLRGFRSRRTGRDHAIQSVESQPDNRDAAGVLVFDLVRRINPCPGNSPTPHRQATAARESRAPSDPCASLRRGRHHRIRLWPHRPQRLHNRLLKCEPSTQPPGT